MTTAELESLCLIEEALNMLGLTDILDDLARGDEDIAELALARLCDDPPTDDSFAVHAKGQQSQ